MRIHGWEKVAVCKVAVKSGGISEKRIGKKTCTGERTRWRNECERCERGERRGTQSRGMTERKRKKKGKNNKEEKNLIELAEFYPKLGVTASFFLPSPSFVLFDIFNLFISLPRAFYFTASFISCFSISFPVSSFISFSLSHRNIIIHSGYRYRMKQSTKKTKGMISREKQEGNDERRISMLTTKS